MTNIEKSGNNETETNNSADNSELNNNDNTFNVSNPDPKEASKYIARQVNKDQETNNVNTNNVNKSDNKSEDNSDSGNNEDQGAKLLTQEEVNEIISKRVNQAKESERKKFADYEELKEFKDKYSSTKEELDKVSSTTKEVAYERDRLKIALEYGFDQDTLDLLPEEGDYDKLKAKADKLKAAFDKKSSNSQDVFSSHLPKGYSSGKAKDASPLGDVLRHVMEDREKRQR